MAFLSKLPLVLFLSSLFLHAAIAELVCENLPNNVCAFSISSSGKRCLLETSMASDNGKVEYQCKTSEVLVNGMTEYIETDKCVEACGVDRKTVGISSDALLDAKATTKLCSPDCYQMCPNIVDLYFNLAAGEGGYLPELCEKQRSNPHRSMSEFLGSGVAPGPVSGSPRSNSHGRSMSELLRSGVAPSPGPVSGSPSRKLYETVPFYVSAAAAPQ
ncbi:hypothetical protein I3843_10G144400 [Carya illinoinensis]|uniref:PAR1 protein n=1 Tax=Carya illinoinensis TaxID=32201 RepID=A0A8T1PEV5_CARIL|nr:uncharacterized protein LOC122279881 [Carya illinoinensis]KAG6640151.1 hypothetical protein CIPAW_10G152700 [Carya illinoinensis]KAG7960800.1 hypothetical protein I3843_10G144400 [Carya illinoinensis]